ncbi:hypothetical protein [Methylobacterium sp. 88A]|uniref:hypothetical protein n=1 Tax=Methylobacterium sp. 88A TaxID=1131813 RepID=UPI0012F6BE25|nr:hypothetical protein [Methylobacterium sp. 88A]
MPQKPKLHRRALPPKKQPIGRFAADAIALRQKSQTKPRAPRKPTIAARGPDIPEAIALDAARYLLKRGDVPAFGGSEPDAMATWFAERMVKFNRENKKQHYETITAAYAMFVASQTDSTLQRAVAEAAHQQNLVVDGRKSQLRIILELHISYGSSCDPQSMRQAGKNYSRDVAAITSLIERGIAPSGVIALASQKGEGLDQWARWKPEGNPEKPTAQKKLKKSLISKNDRSPRKSPFGRDQSHLNYADSADHYLVLMERNQLGDETCIAEVAIDETNHEDLNKFFKFV